MNIDIARTTGRSSRVHLALAAVALLFVGATPVVAAPLPRALQLAAGDAPVEAFVWMGSTPAESEAGQRRLATSRRRALAAAVPRGHVEVTQEYRTLPALVVRADAEGLAAIAAHPGVVAVAPMQYGTAALADSVPQIGADVVHDMGFRGQGAVLALLDTGIDADHPDVAGRVDREECICNAADCVCPPGEECICTPCCPNGTSRDSGPGSARSAALHGPHVAGILASAGIVSSVGVAPDAHLIAIRVLDDKNVGALADWLAGLDLILADHPEVAAINMSLVSAALLQPDCDLADAFTLAFSDVVIRLRRRGTIVVAAAGNNAGDPKTIGKLPLPACLHDVVSVGAVNKSDRIASFSNVASTLDLLAPGVGIVSDAPGGGTDVAGGTSMAAPHVAGSFALLLPLISRPFLAALPGVLKDTGLPILDERLCEHSRCARFPRLDVAAAAEWLGNINALYTGGGSRTLDCQAEFRVEAPPTVAGLRGGQISCRDGDPACDQDAIDDQCTFRAQTCFNVPDRRLITCDPLQTIEAYRLIKPSLTRPRDPAELSNAVRVLGAMPSLPIDEGGQCGSDFDFVVPAGASRTLRISTESLRGRDLDALRFRCRARLP